MKTSYPVRVVVGRGVLTAPRQAWRNRRAFARLANGALRTARPTLVLVAVFVLTVAGSPVGAATRGAGDYVRESDNWFRSDEARRIVTNILSWQSPNGSWPKNNNTTVPFMGNREKLNGTFDNGATTDELRFLSRFVTVTKDTNSAAVFERGLAHILRAQYSNGGWPQYYPPPRDKYHRHITFNDDAMVRLMTFVREVATGKGYDFVQPNQREAAQRAFDRGIDCILKCQIKVNGKLTAWCAQHDEIDFSPRPARTYELASLSGSESAGLVRLLMSLEKPSPEVVRSIKAAVAWFESARIPDIKVVQVEASNTPRGKDKTVVKDANARPMWARFYEIETGQPIFSGRDGVKKYSLAEIEYERRNGYAWLGYWPETLLANEYAGWQRKHFIGQP
ncbi:MAG TPA: pectate lyase [Methylomirabilota bacterium]|nr:pectate lyase [Methylomirabilota bacterium]